MENDVITYQPLSYIDLTEQTYRVLKEKILRGELKPGMQISVPNTAVALGVSRTPVNDALKRLASDGLVEIVPRRKRKPSIERLWRRLAIIIWTRPAKRCTGILPG